EKAKVRDVAQEMAGAIERSDGLLMLSLAKTEDSNDAMNFYEATKRTVEKIKKGNNLKIDTVVTAEDPSAGTAQVDYFLIPVKGQARNAQILEEAGVGLSGKATQLTTYWNYSDG